MASTAPATNLEIAVCGNSFAGKTALVAALQGKAFSANYIATTIIADSIKISLSGNQVCQIWDISGDERHRRNMLRPLYILRSPLCLLVIEPKSKDGAVKTAAELLKEIEAWMLVFQSSTSTQRQRASVSERLMVVISKADTLNNIEKAQFQKNYQDAVEARNQKEKEATEKDIAQAKANGDADAVQRILAFAKPFQEANAQLNQDLKQVVFCASVTKTGIEELRSEIYSKMVSCPEEKIEPVVSLLQQRLDDYAKTHKFSEGNYTNRLQQKEKYFFDHVTIKQNGCWARLWKDTAARKSQNAKFAAYLDLTGTLNFPKYQNLAAGQVPTLTLGDAKNLAKQHPAILDGKLGEIFKLVCPEGLDVKAVKSPGKK